MSERILVNLLSEQRLPNFIAVMQEQPDRVLALCTPPFQGEVARFEALTGVPHTAVHVKAYDLQHNLGALRSAMSGLPANAPVAVNFTGGTKIMSLSAVFAAMFARKQRNIELLYVETAGSRIDRFGFSDSGGFEIRNTEPVSVHIPFQAYAGLLDEPIKPGYLDSLSSDIEARCECAAAMLKRKCDGFFRQQHLAFGPDRKPRPKAEVPFRTPGRDGGNGMVRWDRSGGELVTPDGKAFAITTPNAGEFFAGRWLEECCFARLHRSSRFRQVLANVTLELRPETVKRLVNQGRRDKNELDIVVTDGVRAAIIECKAGRVETEHLHKLHTLCQYLLGSFGVPVLASRHDLPPKEREQAESLGIHVICGERIADLPSTLSRLMRANPAAASP